MFIREFIRHSRKIGAIAPSSKFMAIKMLHSIDLKTADVVVELGAGTGIITHKILEKLNKHAVLSVFETNNYFFESLKNKITDNRVILIHDSAEKIMEYLITFGFSKVDYIISSLPLSSIPEVVKTKIVRNIHEALTAKGTYVQLQYSLFMLSHLKVKFREISISFESLNLPPAFVLSCTK
jgi:phosphatidylethanolamine/phosphatidyl-N-methylethanolamine N-methyltransferase